MKNTELKQLRLILFLDVSEAAKWIGDCEPRTWQRWEKGDRAIPLDVSQSMRMLALTRLEMITYEPSGNLSMYKYYDNYDDFKEKTGASVVKWKLSQSVATELLCRSEADKWREEETI